MNESVQSGRVRQLREEFDGSFRRAREPVKTSDVDALLLRVGTDDARHLLPVSSLTLLQQMPKTRPLPGAGDNLLGLALLRGRVVPVFCLARLLATTPIATPGWVVGIGAELDYALAFAELIELRCFSPAAVRDGGIQSNAHLRQVLLEAGHSTPLISIPSISAALGQTGTALSGSTSHV